MNIHDIPDDYCLVDAASFTGSIMTDKDEWVDTKMGILNSEMEHLHQVWLSLRDRDEAIDKRWASFSNFAEDAPSLQGYIGLGRKLDCTYKGSRVLSRETCVWSPVTYALVSIRDGDEIYFDESHYFQTQGRSGGEQSKVLLRRKLC